MDFDGHDDQEEELGGLPVGGSGYSSPPRPPAPPSRAGVKMGGDGGAAGEQGTASGGGGVGQLGSCHRKTSGGGGSDGGGRYRECLKNHAVGIGGHAVDGCGEFMPAGEEGTLDALKCAACNCHRNFHRKEVDGGGGGLSLMAIGEGGGIGRGFGHHGQFSSPYYRTPGGYLHHHHVAASGHHPALAPPPLALHSTSGGGGTSRDEQEDMSNPMAMGMVGSAGGASTSSGKKRFRTKFTQEQKDRMLAFAERVGWRIQKHDEAVVQQFCSEAGVKRHVLKVWMHNNKHTLGKKP